MPKLGNGEQFDGSSPEEPYFQMGEWFRTVETVVTSGPVTEDGKTYFSLNDFIFTLIFIGEKAAELELYDVRNMTLPILTSAFLHLFSYADQYQLRPKISEKLKAEGRNLAEESRAK